MVKHRTEGELGDFTTGTRVITLTIMAFFISIISTFVAYALVWLINVITNLFFFYRLSSQAVSPDNAHLGYLIILVPVAGGLLVGFLARYGSEKIRGHGIPEALEAILIGRSTIDAKVAALKPISSAISIGTGGPFGVEGPIIMTGGAFGSLFAQLFHLSSAERKTLLVVGAASGMSAIFATPLAAVLLAVELLLFEWKPRSFIPVACAAWFASILRVWLLGRGPIFPIPAHAPLNWSELAVCLGVGLIAGIASGWLTNLVYGFEDLFMRLPLHWMWWPTLGGLFVGIGGLIQPKALGVGYGVIRDLLQGHILLQFALVLLIVKALIWVIALGSGTSGGVLAPLLILGGTLGTVVSYSIPFGDSGLWALVCMGAMLGGTMRCPFTAIVFMLELTHDINVLPGLLIATVAADTVTVLVMRRSILTERLARRGQHVMREYILNPLQQARIEEVMTKEVCTIQADTKATVLLEKLASHDPILSICQAWPILNEANQLVGILTKSDLLKWYEENQVEEKTVLDIGTDLLSVAYPDQLVDEAMSKMLEQNIGRLPVVSRDNPLQLVGMVSRGNLISAWLKYQHEENFRSRGFSTK